jgi:type IX secretion system PorP/SprF family membrane protein
MMRTEKIFLLALYLGAASALHAQDAQLSQYDAAAVMLNPALTGMFESSDFRATCNVRSQWTSLASNFLTTAFAFDMNRQGRYGVGFFMDNYNMAGSVNTFRSGISGAYNVSGAKAKHTLSVGVDLGLMYKKVNDQDLIWDMQYSGDHFDSDLPSGESFNRMGRLMPDIGLGLAYRSVDRNKVVNAFGNFALFHVTTPDESIFREQQSDMPIRYSVDAGAYITVMEGLDLVPEGLYWRQGADQQIQAGMRGEIAFMNGIYSALVGASYRVNDAIIAQAGIKHKNSMYRFSYDVNTSPLSHYTHSNGAFEFSIVYLGTLSGRDRRLQSKGF